MIVSQLRHEFEKGITKNDSAHFSLGDVGWSVGLYFL
jgi:hypothetical protein